MLFFPLTSTQTHTHNASNSQPVGRFQDFMGFLIDTGGEDTWPKHKTVLLLFFLVSFQFVFAPHPTPCPPRLAFILSLPVIVHSSSFSFIKRLSLSEMKGSWENCYISLLNLHSYLSSLFFLSVSFMQLALSAYLCPFGVPIHHLPHPPCPLPIYFQPALTFCPHCLSALCIF